ncbi:MAG: serine/threonine protein kinase, partial [Lapillicoccus sp.]
TPSAADPRPASTTAALPAVGATPEEWSEPLRRASGGTAGYGAPPPLAWRDGYEEDEPYARDEGTDRADGGEDPESDWQAAWEAGPDEPDPRIGRALRTGTLLAFGAALTGAAATWPGVALVVALLWSWAARFSDRSVTALILRRYRYGRRRADLPLAVALSPWHVAVAAALTVVGLLLPTLVALSAAFCTTLGISAATSSSLGGVSAPGAAAGFAAGSLIAWWGPGGASLRRGSRSLVRGIAPSGPVTRVLVAVLLAAAVVLAVLAVARHGHLSWWPFPWTLGTS